MKTIRLAMLIGTVVIFNSYRVGAASITFDLGNGNSVNNSQNGGDGNWIPFADEATAVSTSASMTIGGLEMTINGVANGGGDDTWGINVQGIGIHTDGGSGAASRRIDGDLGEAITFSFDQDVTLSSLRLGSTTLDTEETTVTPSGGSIITLIGSGDPLTDYPLGDVSVTAGTLVTLTTSVPTGGGVLFNEITVDVIPEPTSTVLLGTALIGFSLAGRRRSLR